MAAEPHFSNQHDDDLPMTFRREREARRQQAGGAGYGGDAGGGHNMGMDDPLRDEAPVVTVGAFNVPFFKMVWFFIKAVFAAIPAILLLGVILFGLGQVLQTYLPWLVKMRILISFPG